MTSTRPVALLALLALAAATLTACSQPQPQGQPEAQAAFQAADAWCRAAPASAPAGGCFVTLTAATPDRLLSVETPAAERAEVHTMSMDGGVMRMRQLVDGLALPAGQAVALRPGGEHLMLMAPTQPLQDGGAVPLTFRFEHAPALTLTVPVRTAAPTG